MRDDELPQSFESNLLARLLCCAMTSYLICTQRYEVLNNGWTCIYSVDGAMDFFFEKVPYELYRFDSSLGSFNFFSILITLIYKVPEKSHVLLPITLAQKHRYLVIPSISRRLDKIIEIEFRMKISPTSYVKNAIQYSHLLTRQLLCLLQKSNLHYSTNSLLTFPFCPCFSKMFIYIIRTCRFCSLPGRLKESQRVG